MEVNKYLTESLSKSSFQCYQVWVFWISHCWDSTWSVKTGQKGQESSRRFIYVQLPVQNYIIIQLFMVHATHGWKAYQVHFHNQQKARHFDFSLKSYDY
jgi:hypothetical protein